MSSTTKRQTKKISLPTEDAVVTGVSGVLPGAEGRIHERAIIGGLLRFGADALREAQAAGIGVDALRDPDCRHAWKYAVRQIEAGHPITPTDLLSEGLSVDAVETLIGAEPATSAHIGYHADQLLGERQRSSLADTLARYGDKLADPTQDAGIIAAEIAKTIEGFAPKPSGPLPIDVSAWTTIDPPAVDPVIEDVFDLGDKCAIIASSKMRKSLFLAQLGVSLASGTPFLKWNVSRKFRVLILQFEIQERHYHRRMIRTWKAMGQPDIGDRLHVMNCRGHGSITESDIVRTAKSIGAEIVCLDPLYKIMATDCGENASEDMKPILAMFDRIAQATGAALVYVHHDGKNADDRNIRDRGAGSSVLSRDYDACITLTGHRDNPDTAVIGLLLRNYPPQDEFCATWTEGRFTYDHDTAPVTGKAGRYDQSYRAFMKNAPNASLLEISNAIGCDKSTASRLRARLGVA